LQKKKTKGEAEIRGMRIGLLKERQKPKEGAVWVGGQRANGKKKGPTVQERIMQKKTKKLKSKGVKQTRGLRVEGTRVRRVKWPISK